MAFAIPFVTLSQEKEIKNPDESRYVIKGVMNSNMEKGFWLSDVEHIGIDIDDEFEYSGNYVSETEKVTFSFINAKTNHPDGLDNLILWTWDSRKGKWKRDAEKTENKATKQRSKIISVMMVLDCSGSMIENGSSNFDNMKKSALSFLDNLHQDSEVKDNIHVGIVAFNTTKYADNQSFKPLKLTDNNYSTLRSFIENLPRPDEDAGTAFYYSVDKAVELLEDNYNGLNKKEQGEFIGATLVAFTDGKDNLSKDFNKNITNNERYLKYMQDNFPTHRVGGKRISSTCIAFRAKNADNDEWESMQEDVQSVFGRRSFRTISQMDELNGIFGEIARNLKSSFMILNCQVPSAITGRVAWTIPEYKDARPTPIPPKEHHMPWIGISVEAGLLEGDFLAGLNLDMAFSLTDMIAVGGRLGGLYNTNTGDFGLIVGPEAKITFAEENAVIAGFGTGLTSLSGGDLMLSARFGYKFKNPLFVTAETIYCNGWFGYGVGFGFSFGGK